MTSVFGVLVGLYPSVLVAGIEANVSMVGLESAKRCEFGDPCKNGSEYGEPYSVWIAGLHAGLVLGVAL